MRTDDSTNYHNNPRTSTKFWNFGKEIWCNLEGRYMHIVADLNHLSGSTYSMELCSLGIMGTQYVRDEPVPETLQIFRESQSTETINILHIYSTLTIGNTLQINMRQRSGSELDFVSLINHDYST